MRCGDGDPDAVLAVGPHEHAVVGGVCDELLGVRSASGSQTKLACDGGTVIAGVAQRGGDPGALGDDGVGAGQQFVGGVQARRWRRPARCWSR